MIHDKFHSKARLQNVKNSHNAHTTVHNFRILLSRRLHLQNVICDRVLCSYWLSLLQLLTWVHSGPLARYVKFRIAHAPGMPGTFSPPPPVNDPDMYGGTCVTHVPWCMLGSLTGGFLWSRWCGKRSRQSRRMRNPQFYVSGKRPIVTITIGSFIVFCAAVMTGPQRVVQKMPSKNDMNYPRSGKPGRNCWYIPIPLGYDLKIEINGEWPWIELLWFQLGSNARQWAVTVLHGREDQERSLDVFKDAPELRGSGMGHRWRSVRSVGGS